MDQETDNNNNNEIENFYNFRNVPCQTTNNFF